MDEFRSPVPIPAFDAVSPGNYLGIYGMPMFLNVPTADLDASTDFWLRGLGFSNLFTIPGQLVHLRRWAFQDVLLKAAPMARQGASVSFSCVLGELDEIGRRCAELLPGCTSGPEEMPWNSMDLTVVTPEGTSVVMTAAQPIEPGSAVADRLRAVGIEIPGA
ncbi:glycosyl transferase [Amycolatopsis jejuensis]|uniref:glycosyl transferase n=1 Tax=Amycolatopsis jejuensis TaxID=330084 RepID=UPI0005273601|nr:glycosyl transferase [Amycolatopsis jejuensis]